MQICVQYNDDVVTGLLKRLNSLGRNLTPAMRSIGARMAAATRKRFRAGVGPDGQSWTPSWRVRESGGRTLVKSGHLRDSLSHRATPQTAEWGVNRIYAAIHQFGGVIRPKKGTALKFRTPGGGFATVKSVTIPARPFLGVNDADKAEIVSVMSKRIEDTINAC
jgi:phage virion morphogenesis protein